MASDEILARLDEHMARGNEHMARGNEHMARGNELMDRGNELMAEVREEMRLNRAAYEYGHQVLSRLTTVIIRMDQGLSELVEEVRAMRESFRPDRPNGGTSPATD